MFEFLAQLANANGKQKRRTSVPCQRMTHSPRNPQMNAFVLNEPHRRWRDPSVNPMQSACQSFWRAFQKTVPRPCLALESRAASACRSARMRAIFSAIKTQTGCASWCVRTVAVHHFRAIARFPLARFFLLSRSDRPHPEAVALPRPAFAAVSSPSSAARGTLPLPACCGGSSASLWHARSPGAPPA